MPTEEIHCSRYVDGDPKKPCRWSFVGTSRANAMEALIHHQRERHAPLPTEEEIQAFATSRED